MAVFNDNFSGNAIGVGYPAGWSTHWRTGWAEEIVAGSVNPESDRSFQFAQGSPSRTRGAMTLDAVGAPTAAHVYMLFDGFFHDAVEDIVAGPIINQNGDTEATRQGYSLWVRFPNIDLKRHPGDGTDITVAGVAASTVLSDDSSNTQSVCVEMRRSDSGGEATIECWVWMFGDDRPTSPTITYTDTNPLPAGGVGFSDSAHGAASPRRIAAFSAATEGDIPDGGGGTNTSTPYLYPAPYGEVDGNSMFAGIVLTQNTTWQFATPFEHLTIDHSAGQAESPPYGNDINDHSIPDEGYTGSDSATIAIKYEDETTDQFVVTADIQEDTTVGSPPTLTTSIPNQSFTEGVETTLDLSAYFSGATSYAILGLPSGTGFGEPSSSGLVYINPTAADVSASPIDLTVTASNSEGNVSDAFAATVAAGGAEPNIVQVASQANSVIPATAVFAQQPTEGNALIGIVAINSGSRYFDPPAEWTIIERFPDNGDTRDTFIFWKIAGPDESATVSFPLQPDQTANDLSISVIEVENLTSPAVIGSSKYFVFDEANQTIIPDTESVPANSFAVAAISGFNAGSARIWNDDFVSAVDAPTGGNLFQTAMATKVTSVEGPVGTTVDFSTNSERRGGFIAVFSGVATADPDPDGTLIYALHGAVTDTSFSVVVEPGEAQNVRLQVSTSSAFTTLVYDQYQNADLGSPARFTTSFLSPDTLHYWRATVQGTEIAGSVKTYPSNGMPANVTIALGSCAGNSGAAYDVNADNTSNAPTFQRIEERNPTLFVHMGDLHYKDVESEVYETHRQAIRDVFANPRQSSLYRTVPFVYAWDDHEWGPNNTDKNGVGRDAALAVYPEHLPLDLQPDPTTTGLYQDWVTGRVRHIMLDPRSQRDPGANTMIGPAQKQLLMDAITNFAADTTKQAALILYVGVPWIDSSSGDTWYGFATERAEIAEAIEAAGISHKVLFVYGDSHTLAIDDGTNNTYASAWSPGPPAFNAAPFDATNSTKGGPYSEGVISTSRQQYGVIELQDDSTTVSYTLRGFSLDSSGNETETISYSGTFEEEVIVDPAPATPTNPEVGEITANSVMLSWQEGV